MNINASLPGTDGRLRTAMREDLSKFDAFLCLDACREVMLDGAHLGDAVGERRKLGLGVTPCHDDVQIGAAGAQRLDHVIERKIIVAQRDVEFIQDQKPN